MVMLLVIVFVGAAGLFYWLYKNSRNSTLSNNPVSGIRTRATMASDETWTYVHKRFASVFLLEAWLCLILASIVSIGMINAQSINFMASQLWWTLLWVGALLWLIIVVTGISANISAKHFNSKREQNDYQ